MRGSANIEKFCKQHPSFGPSLWIASVQFFIVQLIVARGWPTGYSPMNNTISDLGNTVCGVYADRYVCSPWYSWMNISFMLLGITVLAGSILLYHQFRKSLGSLVGFGLMGLAGIGTMMVGLFPANLFSELHAVGAFLPFFFGNIALIMLGLSLSLPPLFRFYTIFSGVFSLVAFLLLITDNYLGIGVGGMERLAAHPQTIWLIIFGYYVSRHRIHTKLHPA